MAPFIPEPRRINPLLRLGILVADRVTGRRMLPARLLAWYPKAAVGSGVLESLVAHHDGGLDERMLQLVRVAASLATACPFCIDMNSFGHERTGITHAELAALQAGGDPESVASLTGRERLAITYARLVSATPLDFPAEVVDRLTRAFTPRELVVLASTAAQVNYWARLLQALGVPPAGFGDTCEVPAR